MKKLGWISLILAPIVFLLIWLSVEVDKQLEFQYAVSQIVELDFLESKNLYFWIHLFVFVPVFFLSFDKKVAFYKKWKSLFPAIAIVGLIFIIWDVIFTSGNVWGFNESYISGLNVFGLPIEECMFFITVPFACFFIYECLNAYFPSDPFNKWDSLISIGSGVLLLGLGLYFWNQVYSSLTFIATGLALLLHYYFVPNNYRTKFYRAYLLIWLPFLLVDGALTGSFTEAPVVLYNPEEFIGLRIFSVPIEDAIYNILMLLAVFSIECSFSAFYKSNNKVKLTRQTA